ncbi:MAG: hypothetical protein L0154_18510 [Chloroflexi bacterium]|nr:hypothetical protein [Chloroflexota bacterium]
MNMTRDKQLSQEFISAIEEYRQGALNSRGLAKRAEQITDADEVDSMQDELLSHTFWAMRHLIHRPACWASKPEELYYLARCLRGEDDFDQTFIDTFRET